MWTQTSERRLEKMVPSGIKNSEGMIFEGFLKCWDTQIIHFNWVFSHKQSILGYPIYGNPHMMGRQHRPTNLLKFLGAFGIPIFAWRDNDKSVHCLGWVLCS